MLANQSHQPRRQRKAKRCDGIDGGVSVKKGGGGNSGAVFSQLTLHLMTAQLGFLAGRLPVGASQMGRSGSVPALLFLLLIVICCAAVAASSTVDALNEEVGVNLAATKSKHKHSGFSQSECPGACQYRCSKTAYKKPCMFFCQQCCFKCKCVPPGTYAHKEVCPCYNNWKTKRGGPKCP